MNTGELNELQIINILSSQAVGRLACSDGKYPYVIPITYIFDGENIISQSLEGKKIDIMRKNPHVCLQVDIVADLDTWQSVIVYGLYEELNGDQATLKQELLCEKIMPLLTMNSVHAYEHEISANQKLNDDNRIKNVVFKISIHEKTGRYSKK